MSNVAIFPISTEEDLLFELVFPSVDLSARSFRIEVRERSSAAVKATLTIGAGLTLIGTDRIRARVAKASMAAWTQNIEYTADLVETTGAVNATLVQVRVQFYQPGRLAGSASLGNAATIQIVENTATVISYSGPAVNIGAALAQNVEVTPAGGIASTSAQEALEELDAKKAPKASPVLTGIPEAPTAAPGTDTAQIATTAFVQDGIADLAPLESPALTGTPTAPTATPTTNTTQIATTAMVQAAIAAYLAAQDAMVFKGVIDCSANPNYPTADAGWTYKVSVAGRIGGGSGPRVEVGDTLVCIADGTASGNHATVGAFWALLQTNIDGAVTGPTSATDGHLAQFDGATGKVIKGGVALDTDGTLAANSDAKIATQKAVKTYADTKVGKTGAQSIEGDLTISRASASGSVQNTINNSATGPSVAAATVWATGTLDSWAAVQLRDNSGSPYWSVGGGAAVTAAYCDFAQHIWRSQAGTPWMSLAAGNVAIGIGAAACRVDVLGGALAREAQLKLRTMGTAAGLGGGLLLHHNNEGETFPVTGDRLGYVLFGSTAGASQYQGGGIEARAEGDYSATSTPTYFVFATSPSGTTVRAERMRIAAGGLVSITGSLTVGGTSRPGTFTIATLPSASAVGRGARAAVSDGTSNRSSVESDGTVWRYFDGAAV